MELSTDLLIKIVVLLTAIVGLYKAANLSIAEPFIAQLFASLSILVFPAAMLGFMWITNAMTKVNERPKVSVSYSGSDAEVMYHLTKELRTHQSRQDALKLVIDRAFETKQWGVVVKASEDLIPTTQRDAILMRAIKELKGDKEVSAK